MWVWIDLENQILETVVYLTTESGRNENPQATTAAAIATTNHLLLIYAQITGKSDSQLEN